MVRRRWRSSLSSVEEVGCLLHVHGRVMFRSKRWRRGGTPWRIARDCPKAGPVRKVLSGGGGRRKRKDGEMGMNDEEELAE